MSAKEMFEALGFRKNESICYNNQHILYEKTVMDGTDILTIEFKDGYYVYTSSLHSPMQTYKDVHLAIHQQMIELGWIDDKATPKKVIVEEFVNCFDCFDTCISYEEKIIKCPSCEQSLYDESEEIDLVGWDCCPNCGQRLEYEE